MALLQDSKFTSTPALRLVFMGTPALAGVCLKALLDAPDVQVAAVVTQPDQPKGRGMKLQASPVKEIALAAGIPVLQPHRARDEAFLGQLREFAPELIAVAAYGQILPASVLELPKHGCLNVHTSLLPRYRGASPIQRAILNGDTETGVTIMKMDAGMDTGDIVAQERTPIAPEDTAATLNDRLAVIGAELLVKVIPRYVRGELKPHPQPAEGVSYAPKIRKEEGRIDWTQPARVIVNHVRGMNPWPGAFTQWPGSSGPVLLKIWEAEATGRQSEPGVVLQAGRDGIVVGCGEGALKIRSLQKEGGRRLMAQEFLAGNPLRAGEKLL